MRQRATVWKAYGTGPAILAGDALFALAVQTLAEAPGRHSAAAVRQLAGTLTDLVRGQADDLLFESRPWSGPEAVQPHEYRWMAENKTGALLGCAAGLGAVLAGAPDTTVEALARAGRRPRGGVPGGGRSPGDVGGSRGHRQARAQRSPCG